MQRNFAELEERVFDVLVIGDFMLDQHVYGAAERLSPDAPVPVLARSLDAMLKSAVRTHLAATRAFAVRNGLEYRAVAIPEEVDVGRGFDFSVETMQTIYDHGYRIGLTGEGWDAGD